MSKENEVLQRIKHPLRLERWSVMWLRRSIRWMAIGVAVLFIFTAMGVIARAVLRWHERAPAISMVVAYAFSFLAPSVAAELVGREDDDLVDSFDLGLGAMTVVFAGVYHLLAGYQGAIMVMFVLGFGATMAASDRQREENKDRAAKDSARELLLRLDRDMRGENEYHYWSEDPPAGRTVEQLAGWASRELKELHRASHV